MENLADRLKVYAAKKNASNKRNTLAGKVVATYCTECDLRFEQRVWHCPVCKRHHLWGQSECGYCHSYCPLGLPKLEVQYKKPNPYHMLAHYLVMAGRWQFNPKWHSFYLDQIRTYRNIIRRKPRERVKEDLLTPFLGIERKAA